MRAVALVAPGEVRLVDDWPEPECGPRDVVVSIRGVGLCGSDLSVFDGKREVPRMPWVFGHEGGGDVVAVGSEVTNREVGQRVIIEPNFADLTCAACLSGHTSACVNRQILAINRTGMLAERVAVPAEFTWPTARDLADVALACFEPHAGRMDLALKFGARRAEERASDQYPFVFETAGVPAVWEPALAAVARTGKLILIGFHAKPVQFVPIDLVQRQITIVGQLIYDHPQDFAATLEAVTAGVLAPEQTVQASFPVEETAQALASVREIPGKTWINLASWREES